MYLLTSCTKGEVISRPTTKYFNSYITDIGYLSKTHLDAENERRASILWSDSPKKDELSVFCPSSDMPFKFTLRTGANSKNGTFAGEIQESETYYAIYPHSEENRLTDGNIQITIPNIQKYSSNNIYQGTLPMYATSSNSEFEFVNLCGILQLLLKGNSYIKKIEIISDNYITGPATIDIKNNSNSIPTINFNTEQDCEKVMVLDCSENPVRLNDDKASVFNIVLPPSKDNQSILNVIIYDINDKSISKSIPAVIENIITASQITRMPEITVDFDNQDNTNDYIDEYNINHGPGIEINGLLWAPVNLGYHKDDYKYGKLYQGGRPYGQGYTKDDKGGTFDWGDNLIQGPVSEEEGFKPENQDKFYYNNTVNPYDWCNNRSENYSWKIGYNPCPNGWRVPTKEEFEALIQNREWSTVDNINGYYVSGENLMSDDANKIFLPAAGRNSIVGLSEQRNSYGYYWTSECIENNIANFYFRSSTFRFKSSGSSRAIGYSIRCVK